MRDTGGLRLALLLCGLAFVLLYRIGDAPAANPAEARVEAVVRGMTLSGDWLVPRIDGQPRLHKPPGFYWVATALSRLGGEPSWTSVRAGSALAAIGMVAATFAWGRALGGPTLGLVAALCLCSMQFTFAFGRRGVADMMLAACSTLALASFDRVRFERRWIHLLPLGLGLTGAILAKATAALLFAGVPIGLQLALDGRRREGRRVLATFGMACAVGFLWYGIVLVEVPGAGHTFLSEAVLPMGIQVEGTASALHYKPPTSYLSPLILGMLPAALFLPLAIRRGLATRGWSHEPRLRFVARAALSLAVVLALIPQKQRHYLLPLLPLFSLLMAEAIVELEARAPERMRVWLARGTIGLAPLALLALLALARFYGDFLGMSAHGCALLLGSGGALLAGLYRAARQGRMRAFAALSAIASLSAMLGWFGGVGLWRTRFEAGTAMASPEYDAARWREAARHNPLIERFVRSGADRG